MKFGPGIVSAEVPVDGGAGCVALGIVAVPRQPDLPIYRRLVLPVHLLGRSSPAALLCCVSPVAGDVEFQDDGVVDDPVNRRGGGHGVGELVYSSWRFRRLLVHSSWRSTVAPVSSTGRALGQVAQVVQEQEVEAVQLVQLPGQVEVTLGGEQVPCFRRGRLCTRR